MRKVARKTIRAIGLFVGKYFNDFFAAKFFMYIYPLLILKPINFNLVIKKINKTLFTVESKNDSNNI